MDDQLINLLSQDDIISSLLSCFIFDFSNMVLFLVVCRFEYVFELFTTKDSFRVYQFAAESEAERAQWMKCVAQVRYHYISQFLIGRNEFITSSFTSSFNPLVPCRMYQPAKQSRQKATNALSQQ